LKKLLKESEEKYEILLRNKTEVQLNFEEERR